MKPQAIRFPKIPEGIDNLSKYPCIQKNWQYSYQRVKLLSDALHKEISNSYVSVAVAGSFGRFDANKQSDLDFFILLGKREASAVEDVMSTVIRIAKELKFELPNANGVFSEVVTLDDMIEKAGSKDDSIATLAQRMLLLMETKPIYNNEVYQDIVNRVLRKYLDYVLDDPSKEAVFFLNDIIRYFRSICVNYQFNFWKEETKWVIRNVKLRHSRIIMYAGLLLLVLNASKHKSSKTDKFSYISSRIQLTPIEKILSVYNDNSDTSYRKILNCYDVFLNKLSDSAIRASLNTEYDDRYSNPHYAELKVTSTCLQTELTRFIFAQKGNWTDAVFEYLLF